MTPHDNRFEAGLSDADVRWVERMKTLMEAPPLSESTLRSLRTGGLGRPVARSWMIRASMPLAAGTLAAALILLTSLSPRGQTTTSTTQALSFGTEGEWNYELFAPPEFDEFSLAYRDEMLLPVEYAAFEYWVD